MKTLLAFAAACAALTLGACATFSDGPIVDGHGLVREDGFAMLGQPTRVGKLVVTPQTLVEDSRCPMNARCIWAGRLVVTTRIDGPGWRETANLTLGQAYPTHGTRVTLTSAVPEKTIGAGAILQASTFGFQGGL